MAQKISKPKKTAVAKKAPAKQTKSKKEVNTPKSFLKKVVSKHSNIILIEGVLFLVLSIMMLVKPMQSLYAIVATMGVAITVIGMFYLVKLLTSKQRDKTSVLDLVFCIINIVFGIVLIIFPGLSFPVFITILALIFLVRGIYFLAMSIDVIKFDNTSGIVGIIIALLSLLIFALVVIYPISAAYAATIYIALCLMLYGLADLALAFRMKKINRKL